MLRSWLVLLLLTNYLLVVGAGLVNRPEAPRYSAAHPYVHSADCQQQHYLRLDCFERCNGDQTEVTKRPAGENAQHLILTLKGVDAHCLTAAPAPVPSVWSPVVALYPAEPALPVPTGALTILDSPPRRG